MYERVLYHDMHGCNHEKGFDVFLQGAGKVPLLNAASETDGSAVASRNTPKSQNANLFKYSTENGSTLL